MNIARAMKVALTLLALSACATSPPNIDPIVGVWDAGRAGEYIEFRSDGRATRYRDNYPEPPPVHSTAGLVWERFGDQYLVRYESMPTYFVMLVRVEAGSVFVLGPTGEPVRYTPCAPETCRTRP